MRHVDLLTCNRFYSFRRTAPGADPWVPTARRPLHNCQNRSTQRSNTRAHTQCSLPNCHRLAFRHRPGRRPPGYRPLGTDCAQVMHHSYCPNINCGMILNPGITKCPSCNSKPAAPPAANPAASINKKLAVAGIRVGGGEAELEVECKLAAVHVTVAKPNVINRVDHHLEKRVTNPASAANVDKNYRPMMRFAGSSKILTPDCVHNTELVEKLRAKYGFGDDYDISKIGHDSVLIVEYYCYMLAETGHSVGYNAKKKKLTNDGLCYVYPRKIGILLESCFFDELEDFDNKNRPSAKACADEWATKFAVNKKWRGKDYDTLTPEQCASQIKNYTGHFMCAYDLFTELLTTYGKRVASSPEPQSKPVDDATGCKRKFDTLSRGHAKRPAVEPPIQPPIQPPEKNSPSGNTECVEYREDEDDFFAVVHNVFDGGVDAEGVDSSFKFVESSKLYLDSSKLYPLIGKELNLRLLKHGDGAGRGFLHDEIISACCAQINSLQKDVYVVPLGVTMKVVNHILNNGEDVNKPKRDVAASKHVIFVVNVGGDCSIAYNQRKGNHWVTLCCDRSKPGEIFGFNSLFQESYNREMEELAGLLKDFVWPEKPELKFEMHPIHCVSAGSCCVQQPPMGFDCGIFALFFAHTAASERWTGNTNWSSEAEFLETCLNDPLEVRRKIAAHFRDWATTA